MAHPASCTDIIDQGGGIDALPPSPRAMLDNVRPATFRPR